MGKKGEIHVFLTREQKSKLCIYVKGHKNLNQNKLKQWIKNTFKLDVNRSTISKIITRYDSIESDPQNIGNHNSKRNKIVTSPKLETELLDLFSDTKE